MTEREATTMAKRQGKTTTGPEDLQGHDALLSEIRARAMERGDAEMVAAIDRDLQARPDEAR